MEPSQLLNKVLGRNTDTGGVEFWRQPERSGWLMKQGGLGKEGGRAPAASMLQARHLTAAMPSLTVPYRRVCQDLAAAVSVWVLSRMEQRQWEYGRQNTSRPISLRGFSLCLSLLLQVVHPQGRQDLLVQDGHCGAGALSSRGGWCSVGGGASSCLAVPRQAYQDCSALTPPPGLHCLPAPPARNRTRSRAASWRSAAA